MGTDRQDVIAAAIQLETDGRDFYLSVADKTASELARKMFTAIAEDELRHMEWIKALSAGEQTAESANRDLYGRLRPIFAAAPPDRKPAAELSADDLQAVDVAIGKEDASIAAYEEWAREDNSEEVQDLCRVLAGQERFHRQVLENTRTYLDRTADWFMQEEQWNFEGG